MNAASHPASRDEWTTPQHVFDDLNTRYGPFDLDAAATAATTKIADAYYTASDNALTLPWFGRVFCNPPYSRPAPFVERAIRETRNGHADVVVMLVPASVHTIWYREGSDHAHEALAHSGGLRFSDAKHAAPFGSSLLVFRPPTRMWSPPVEVPYAMPKRHRERAGWYPLKCPEAVRP